MLSNSELSLTAVHSIVCRRCQEETYVKMKTINIVLPALLIVMSLVIVANSQENPSAEPAKTPEPPKSHEAPEAHEPENKPKLKHKKLHHLKKSDAEKAEEAEKKEKEENEEKAKKEAKKAEKAKKEAEMGGRKNEILTDADKISKHVAEEHAMSQVFDATKTVALKVDAKRAAKVMGKGLEEAALHRG